ncbi:SH3 domain-containing protein [Xylariaceae sp. FL1272]|nr:SH3 domain-containing protein [Xylariaceae sp. FL1272]
MAPVDRQDIIASNKSLRLIKNELESLVEKGVIDDHVFDSILNMLPAESSLSAALTPAARNPTSPPINAMANLALAQNPSRSPAPPAYHATGPPALPSRTPSAPAPPPPSKPIIARARALYKYTAADDRDLSFERDDRVAVHEYMNADWWMGRNERTGAEGIFPKNYVQVDGPNEKSDYYAPQQPTYASPAQTNGGYPPPPKQHNPYSSQVPPMAVAQGGEGSSGGSGSKVGEHGKKFGKKLGNAAVFGAGATLGGKIVNSIF